LLDFPQTSKMVTWCGWSIVVDLHLIFLVSKKMYYYDFERENL
jgi:hypothetical protein